MESTLDLVVVGTREAVSMVEAGAKEVSEELMLEAILAGHDAVRKIIDGIEELARRTGTGKALFPPPAGDPRRRDGEGPVALGARR